jgi:hypothetical protein
MRSALKLYLYCQKCLAKLGMKNNRAGLLDGGAAHESLNALRTEPCPMKSTAVCRSGFNKLKADLSTAA